MIHLLDEKDRKLRLQDRAFVQNGIATDYIEVRLEDGGAFDGCDTVLLTMTRDGMQPVAVRLGDGPVEVPASLMEATGPLRFSLTGYVGDEVRATTVLMKSSECGIVVASGTVSGGEVPPQDAAPDLWKQLMDEVDAATGGAEDTLEKAEQAAKRAEGAASDAEAALSSAADSESKASAAASAASDSASSAASSAGTAADFATEAGNAKTAAETAKAAAEKAKTDAESAETAAANSASQAQQSATAAASSAASVADKFISSAQATTLEPGSQATASVEDQVLTIGVPKGEKGDKGDTGDTGKQGVQGDKGDPGTAATIAVGSVTGLAAGASPTVVNSGTANAAVLDFGIPKGDKGDKGDTGIGVPEGGEPGQLLSKTDSGTAWVDPPSGNVLTGTSTGYVAHAEDAYAQKPIEVRVKGKTWLNRWPVLSGSNNGITVATDGTGLVTVTGTATADADIVADVSGWATGKSCTATISVNPTGCNAYFEVRKPSGNTSINATTAGATLNVASDATNCVAGVHVASGTTVNASFRVMLVDGTEAPDCFTPCASIASAQPENLVTAGKNLINTSGASVLDDNSGVRLPNVTLQPGTYVVKRPSGLTGSFSIYREGDTSSSVSSITEAGTSFTLTSPIHGLDFRSSDAGQITLDNISQFQLELGSTATAYEPPAVTATPLPEVELRSLPNGTCDELVIRADGTCEVERKTHSYTATGEENVIYGGGQARFDTGIPFIFVPGSSINFFCDKLPIVTSPSNMTGCSFGVLDGNAVVYFNVSGETTDADTSKAWLASNTPTFVFARNKTTEPQSPVILPVLPAPTFNQYHDADVPSDTGTTYARDINIVLANLEAVQTALLGGE